jgi:hypothetical protein
VYNYIQYKQLQKRYHRTNTLREVKQSRSMRGRKLISGGNYIRGRRQY